MNWKIAEAKQRFSRLVRAAEEEPQVIFNRDRPVAAVVEIGAFEEFLDWREAREEPSLAAGAEAVRRVFGDEGYALELEDREDRPNAFAEGLDALSR